MPRFVILEHDYPEQHWDFMLENGDHLRTWKLIENPQLLSAPKEQMVSIKAVDSADHRRIYLDYEGPLTNDRGFVTQFDQGTFAWLEQSNEQIVISLQGKKLNGTAKLTKLKNDIDQNNWQLEFIVAGVIN